MAIRVGRKERLIATIVVAFSFFIAELVAGFYTHSLALVADAFHYLSDLIGFMVALVAVVISERSNPPPQEYTFGWQRATLLGAFFNGVFLLALGVSILVQAVERFASVTPIDQPKVVLIVGCVGLGLNILVMSYLHEHDHDHDHGHNHSTLHDEESAIEVDGGAAVEVESRPMPTSNGHHGHRHTAVVPTCPGRDLGILGALVHVIGDAINNIGVIISAVIIWKAQGEARYYADPAIGVFIAVMVFLTAIPVTKNSGAILLQIAPVGIDLEDVKHDIEMIPGIESVHELHIWRLDQRKSIASAHVVVDGRTVNSFTDKAKIIMECLHAYGIHSATLQPEVDLFPEEAKSTSASMDGETESQRRRGNGCQLICGSLCGGMRCCNSVQVP